jgi:hypothetical protein
MMVQCYDSEIEVPDALVEKFIKDFDCLPGSGQYESIAQLRGSIFEVLDIIAEEPEMLREPEYLADFIRAVAMRKALEKHGILYDA